MYNSNGLLIGFVELRPSPSPSFDYFPADRSTIDSQVVVNNYHVLDTSYDDTGHPAGTFSKGSGILYVAVRNEQGSTGHYRVHADRVPVSDVGPGTTDPLHFGRIREDLVINPETGTASFTVAFNTYDLLLNTPHGLTSAQPTLSVTAKTTTESI